MRRSQSLGIQATANMAYGDIADEIIERARWADLVVINQRRVHGQWAERPLGSIFQVVATQSARPVLAVPGTRLVPMRKALLAYDGSPKAQEALFLFRHILTHWGLEGTILTVESSDGDREMLDQAWEYVHAAKANVSTRLERGAAANVIARVMGEEEANLLLMGGSGYQPILRAFLGSTVDRVLRVAWFPVLICR
jgi:nucleotide-binding universal stress UspA family protein